MVEIESLKVSFLNFQSQSCLIITLGAISYIALGLNPRLRTHF